jgi:signal transduction histidine kinase
MKSWLRGKRGGAVAFLLISALVAGGLGWVTAAALRLEQEQLEARARGDLNDRLQFALSLLDSAVRPGLAREDGRPYHHYSALSPASQALSADGTPFPPGAVQEPSPLLSAELPDWVLLHFQADERDGWSSPEVPAAAVRRRLDNPRFKTSLANVTPERARLLAELSGGLAPPTLLASAREHAAEPTLHDTALVPAARPADNFSNPLGNFGLNSNPDNYAGTNPMPGQQQAAQGYDPGYAKRAQQQERTVQQNRAMSQKENLDVANSVLSPNDSDRPARPSKDAAREEQVDVVLSPMVPLWLTGADGQERLLFARVVRVADRQAVQGVLLDVRRLQDQLAAEVSDMVPDARLVPVHGDEPPDPERTLRKMTALPFRLDPGPAALAVPEPGWTPLRVGLSLAWAAALVALLAVGLGGWSLIDLSERRIRFVSAVTHELRTPLTTLRLYLDMLTGGLVKEERQRQEYLHTLHAEADRLNRLVGNVLDFSRLENQRPRLVTTAVAVPDLLEQVRATWQARCQDAGKELAVEDGLGDGAVVVTDAELVQQVLGNLIDNACKYSRDAADPRVCLRARRAGPARLVLEVEDRGPGVAPRERRAIFRPFRRGRGVDATAGGVGLGLALAERWAGLLGGRLTLHPGAGGAGACFRLELPAAGG